MHVIHVLHNANYKYTDEARNYKQSGLLWINNYVNIIKYLPSLHFTKIKCH